MLSGPKPWSWLMQLKIWFPILISFKSCVGNQKSWAGLPRSYSFQAVIKIEANTILTKMYIHNNDINIEGANRVRIGNFRFFEEILS